MSLTKASYSMITGAPVNAADSGVSSSASAATNLANFKLAVAATPTNGVLVIPQTDTFYSIDTTGGESTAIEINKAMTVVFEGSVKAIGGAIQANPTTAFYVTGNNVKFVGTGTIYGDGTINQVNTGTPSTTPSLVKVTGNFFEMSGLTINTPYKVGVYLSGSNNSRIVNCNFTGGPTSYQDTGYFGIYLYQGGRHIVSENQFYPATNGGMYVQCVFTSGANACTLSNNIAYRPYEKIFYINGSDNLVTGNICYGNTGTVPGTNYVGTASDALRCSGSRNVVKNNYLNYVAAGITSISGGTGNNFSENVIYNCGQGGIGVYGGSVVLDSTTISDNVIVCGNLANSAIQDGIYVNASTGTNYFLDISGNTVVGFSPTDPLVNVSTWTATTTIPYHAVIKPTVPNSRYYSTLGGGVTGSVEPTWPTTPGVTVVDGTVTWTCLAFTANVTAQIRVEATSLKNSFCDISNNLLSVGNIGISTTYLNNSDISNNHVSADLYTVIEANGTKNQYRNNLFELATAGAVDISGLGATCKGVGNIWQQTSSSAVSTASAGVSTYVYSGTLMTAATNAYVQVTPVNATAAAFIAANGVFAVQASPNINVTSGNGTNFAGTEQFLLMLIQ